MELCAEWAWANHSAHSRIQPHGPTPFPPAITASTCGPTWSATRERALDNWGPAVRREATPTSPHCLAGPVWQPLRSHFPAPVSLSCGPRWPSSCRSSPRTQRHLTSCGFLCGPVDLVSAHLQSISTAPLGPRHRFYLNLPPESASPLLLNSATKAKPMGKG
jgi:hypothetical protein